MGKATKNLFGVYEAVHCDDCNEWIVVRHDDADKARRLAEGERGVVCLTTDVVDDLGGEDEARAWAALLHGITVLRDVCGQAVECETECGVIADGIDWGVITDASRVLDAIDGSGVSFG